MSNWMKLTIVVMMHHILVLTLVATPFICLIYEPWYITITLTALIVRLGTSGEDCILTRYEDKLRESLHLNTTGGRFIGYYYVDVIRRYL